MNDKPCQHPEVREWDCGDPWYINNPCCKHNYQCTACGLTMKGKPAPPVDPAALAASCARLDARMRAAGILKAAPE